MQEYSRNGHRKRLRTQFIENGINGISDCSVLELYLSLVIPRKDVKQLSYDLMNKYKDLKGVFSADEKDLMEFKGIGEHTAQAIKAFNDMLNRPVKPNNPALYDLSKPVDRAVFLCDIVDKNGCDIMFGFFDSNFNYIGNICYLSDFKLNADNKNEILRRLLYLNASFVVVSKKSDSDEFDVYDRELIADLKEFLNSFGISLYDYVLCHNGNAIVLSQSKSKNLLSVVK